MKLPKPTIGNSVPKPKSKVKKVKNENSCSGAIRSVSINTMLGTVLYCNSTLYDHIVLILR